ncbi:cation:proton antiporter [Candidatus Peregrinibacteria bacterium]|nr:MAG: cation:proton antiporter [Candidatus Peregrinibacteria bacterium]
MSILTATFWIIVWVYAFGKVAGWVKIPHIVALILVGLFLNIPQIHALFLQGAPVDVFVSDLGDIALVALMLLAGLETSVKEFKHESKEAVSISLIAALTPFTVGFLAFYWLGYDLLAAMVVGVSMSITAEATTAALLLELKKIKSRVGTLMMEAGIIDDVLGMSLFVMITLILDQVHLREDVLLVVAILAFFLGILLQKRFHRAHVSIVALKKWTFLLIVPFFFVSMGSHFDLQSVLLSPQLLGIILLIAFFGKMGGTFLARPFTRLTWRQLHLIGWAMNSRGAVGLALALLAFRTHLISVELYSSLLLMSLLTTIAFPFVITRMIRRHPKIMD